MTWFQPWGWLWGALAVPVILLYSLRMRRRRHVVASTQFWDEVFRESRPRAWWQRLRHLVSLLLQLVFLFLLVMAVADPITSRQQEERRLWVLLLDRSASMSAPADPVDPGGETRLELARGRAMDLVNRMREWDEAMVIPFADGVEVACGRTADPGALRQALRRIRPSDMPGDASAATAFAATLHDPDRKREIVVFTDRTVPDDSAPDTNVRWVRVGRSIDNVGITAFASRAADERPDLQRLLLRVLNASDTPRHVSVSLRADEEPFDSVFFYLAEGEEQAAIVEHSFPGAAILEARIVQDQPDGIRADDRAHLVIPAPSVLRVTLVTPTPNLFLQEVLAAQPLVMVSIVTPDAAASLSAETTDLVVFYRYVPNELPTVHSLYIQPGRDSELWTLGDEQQRVLISNQDHESPLLRHVRFDQVLMHRATPLETIGATPVLESFGSVLCASWQRESHRVIALSVDLEASDLPLRTAFPILMANAVNWLGNRSADARGAARTGALVRVPVGDADEVMCRGPSEWNQTVPVSGESATIGPIEFAGLYRLFRPGEDRPFHTFAANLASREESGRGAESADTFADAEFAGLGAGRALWIRLALAALLLLVIEWGLHQRRVIE